MSDNFYSIWRRYQDKDKTDKLPLCPVASEFLKKLEDTIFTPLGQQPTRGQVAQGKYMLQEAYHTWRKSVPSRHLRSTEGHHRCLDQVYDAAYDRLHLKDLTLRSSVSIISNYQEIVSPPVVLPPPPAPVVIHEVSAITFGEEIGDGDSSRPPIELATT